MEIVTLAFTLFFAKAGEQVLSPEQSLRFSTGSWHSSKVDEIPMQTSCGIRKCEPPTDFQSTEAISALNDIFKALGGSSWSAKYGWGVGHPCYQFWYGVECNAKGQVIRLQLQNNGLHGSVPSSIANLTSLIEINFRSAFNYAFTAGSYGNFLTGDFPSVSAITGLRTLDLSGAGGLTSLPADLSENSNLEILDASGNLLTALPAGLDLMTNLKILRLHDNQISDIFPPGICNLIKLLFFNVAGSVLTGTIPECIATSLNPIVFDISTTQQGVDGEIPLAVIQSWTNIKHGYLSIYGQYDMTGAIADICTNFHHCYYHTFELPVNLAFATQQSQVPQVVIDTMDLAATR